MGIFSREVQFATPQPVEDMYPKLAALQHPGPRFFRDGRHTWRIKLMGDARHLSFKLTMVMISVGKERETLWPIAHAVGTATALPDGNTLVKFRFEQDLIGIMVSVVGTIIVVLFGLTRLINADTTTADLIWLVVIIAFGVAQWFVTRWTIEGRVLGHLRKHVFGTFFPRQW